MQPRSVLGHSLKDVQVPFGPVRQIDAGLLNVGYVDAGPVDGPAVILVHGWPYDIHSFAEVTPILTAAGFRVVVPYVRGFGSTRFLSSQTPRNEQQAALAADTIALMDALGIDSAIVAGFDWGARTADAMAILWPRRARDRLCQRLHRHRPRGQPAAAGAAGRARLVVPVLLRHRARTPRLPREHRRVQQAHLADRVTGVGVQRRHLRPNGRRVRQPRSCRRRRPQLSLAAEPGGR
ncbi:alpha/beta fold hydrolase [Conexibacter stalactiti]|uniref:Alpha/beta fold hydrolase n=1 Tax=Conexibacter stalactiti TaxID=1940611 RepID=A0ABU4HIL2_9ACTN|nr:alpha/beta fold hydrolase [Conexibacter stalactiti]MDW5593141.1 alpha/beta fold hydrolase [Conexibacter stalactiti]MEC5033782.1 alpha/beta fold hydrolase [Conexibacter stalactiti]